MIEEDEAVVVIQFPKDDAAAGNVLQVVVHIKAEMLRNGCCRNGALFP
jgi:hypothetical protein